MCRGAVQKGDFCASLWQDRKAVTVMSTGIQPDTGTVLRRQKDGSRISVPCPQSIISYNEHMGGVDRGDQIRGYYSCRTKCRKNYKYIFHFLFGVATTVRDEDQVVVLEPCAHFHFGTFRVLCPLKMTPSVQSTREVAVFDGRPVLTALGSALSAKYGCVTLETKTPTVLCYRIYKRTDFAYHFIHVTNT